MTRRLVVALCCASLAALSGSVPAAATAVGAGSGVFPTLRRDLIAHYDFEHPNGATERDRGRSGTDIALLNGASRVRDGFRHALQTKQVAPTVAGNDDWKAGVYSPTGVPSLRAFNAASAVTVMGWFKPTGVNPSPNTVTADPTDYYNAMALYRDGRALDGFYTVTGDPWVLDGPPEPDVTTASDPRGIKIGGSFPQNTVERNPCDCRMDELMFLDRVVSPTEVWLQYLWARSAG